MTSDVSTPAQQFEFRAEVQQLLNILVHSLYTDREIFLREAISNASDALSRFQFEALTNPDVLDPDLAPAIRITFNESAKTLTISDTGIGMTHDELIENLGTIAHSGAKAFIEALQTRGGGNSSDIIGQFGVGFYSLFMVADEVRVTTRSFQKEGQAWTWISRGDSTYSIEPADKATRGSDVMLFMKEDAIEFLNNYRLESIIRKHSDFVPFPIYVSDEEKAVNQQTALWRRNPREVTDAEYLEFYKQFTYDIGEPLARVHINTDAPVQFYSLLYVPSKADRGLFNSMDSAEFGPRLYARKVLIQQHAKDLLPQWMRFVEGVVDSEDLPLNISRETVQANRVMARLKNAIGSKLVAELESLAERDPAKYATFWQEFGRLLKEGIATDSTYHDRLLKLLRFHSSRDTEGWVSLAEYKGRMVEGQTEIYYLFGEDVKSLARSPHLDLFRARGIEVLFLTEPIDSFAVTNLKVFEDVPFRNASDSDLNLPSAPEDAEPAAEPLSDTDAQTVLDRFKAVLGDRADVRQSSLLTDSPVRLVTTDKGMRPDLERVYRMLNQPIEAPKRVLEINPRNPIIRELAALDAEKNETIGRAVIEQLYESALLLEGVHPNPADMVSRIQTLMEAALRKPST